MRRRATPRATSVRSSSSTADSFHRLPQSGPLGESMKRWQPPFIAVPLRGHSDRITPLPWGLASTDTTLVLGLGWKSSRHCAPLIGSLRSLQTLGFAHGTADSTRGIRSRGLGWFRQLHLTVLHRRTTRGHTLFWGTLPYGLGQTRFVPLYCALLRPTFNARQRCL